jgi:hypothetical protein
MTDNLWLKKVRKVDGRVDIEGRSIDNEIEPVRKWRAKGCSSKKGCP